ncbi:lantibiotic dehydratase [Streptomyces sp. NPDC050610]|uniref:lantibiotic dehydratase n=1 Tax=Streptomyces sp. NPDC050610 TaxID=3157097 RepID=UPI0034450062
MRGGQSAEPLFRCADGMLLRAPLLARDEVRATWWDTENNAQSPEVLRARLVGALADDRFREAVEVSSPSLARTADAALSGRTVAASDLRKALRAVTRYRLRAASRPTPFGLMAGVLWGSFGDTTKGELTGEGHKAARPDASWLSQRVAAWERDPAVLPGLSIVANGLCFVRGGRLVLPFAPDGARLQSAASGDSPADDGLPKTRTLKYTPVVRSAVEATARPLPYGELVRHVEADFPGAPDGAVRGLIAQLIAAEVLLTDLRPPLDTTDPLAHVERLLPAGSTAAGQAAAGQAAAGQAAAGQAAAGQVAAGQVAALRSALADYGDTPLGAGTPAWRTALGTAASIQSGSAAASPTAPAHSFQVDLRLDGTVVLSRDVAREIEQAAAALWRLSPPGPGRLSAYHQEFVERYGLGRFVPVKELLDPDIGLGAPAGYRLPPSHRPAPDPLPIGAARQRLLLGLAAEAQARGVREAVLGEEWLSRFEDADRDTADTSDTDTTVPPPLELTVQIAAESATAVDRGDFTLALNGAATASGGLMGRFAHLLPPAQAEALRRTVRAAREGTGRLPVQVHHQAAHHRHANVAQVPSWLDGRLVVGAHPGPAAPGVTDLTLDDVLVSADSEGFRIASAALGREVTPSALHVLNRELAAPNAVRFLIEAAAFGRRQWRMWDWGAADDLPFLPAVRTGRTVLSPARWRLDATNPPLDEWRALWGVPDHVQLALGDHRIPLNLTVPAHREILRRECERRGVALVHEPPTGQDVDGGWLHGPGGAHDVEAVVTLTPCRAQGAVRRPAKAATIARASGATVRHGTGEIPPGGPWLYATLYSSAERQDELLTGPLRRFLTELPSSLAGSPSSSLSSSLSASADTSPEMSPETSPDTPGGVDRWFFIRYADPHPHLRLRLHGKPELLNGLVLPRLHDLAAELADAGLARGLRIDSYAPETERYGGTALLNAAEEVFHADSLLVLERLAAPADDRILSAAHDVAHLVRSFHHGYGGDWRHWLTATYPKREKHHKAFAARRAAALARITPDGAPDPLDPLDLSNAPGSTDTSGASYGAAPRRFGRLVREAEERGTLSVSPDTVLASLVHMHCNRRLGADRTAEAQALAVARGAVQAHLDRERARS